MKELITYVIGFLTGFIIGVCNVQASEIINCNYSYGMKSFTTSNVVKAEQIEREFEIDGLKYKVHIENTKAFTEVDDYIVIENSEGHRITYALECK